MRRLASLLLVVVVVALTACAGGDESGAVAEAPDAESDFDFRYELNGNFDEQGGGQPLVANGGTLGANGYTFGPNQGLTFDGSVGTSYTIELRVRLDSVTLATGGWVKLLDFRDRGVDAGIYVYLSSLAVWFSESCGAERDVGQGCVSGVPGRMALAGPPDAVREGSFHTIRIIRDGDAATIIGVIDGNNQLWSPLPLPDEGPVEAVNDPQGETAGNSSGVLHFLMDDRATGTEAASGELDYIYITID